MALSRWRRVAAVFSIVACALGLGSSALLAPEADALVSISTLTAVDGAVLVRHTGADFTPAREGDVLVAGDTIRTWAGASAEITYVEGSSVRLEANAEIVVEGLRTCDDGPAQAIGRAWHVAAELVSGSSRYQLRGPSATASVRG